MKRRMTRVYPKLQLHSTLNAVRGITAEKAIRTAAAEMGAHEEAAFEIVDARIADLRAMCASRSRPLDPAEVFDAAEDVVDLSGLFSPHLCRAAQSLCALAQKSVARSTLDRTAVHVHVESLHLLRMMGNSGSATSDAIVEGLVAVVARARVA